MTVAALSAASPGSVRTVSRDYRPLAGGQTTYANGICVANPGGTKPGFYGEATGALGEVAVGRFYGQYGNATNSGADGSVSAHVEFFRERKLFLVNNDTTNPVAAANRESMVSILNDNYATVDTDGQRADMGIFYDFSEDGSGELWVEFPYPSSTQDQGPSPTPAGGPPFTARCVMIGGIGAYTGSGTGTLTVTATGALVAGDGVTPAVNDLVLLPEGAPNISAASDAGVYQVINAGGTGISAVVKRVSWWYTGAPIPLGQGVRITEGTLFGGQGAWKSDAVKGKIVDTDAPLLYPEHVNLQVTLAAGVFAITTVPLRSATKSSVQLSYAGSGTPNASTLSYQAGAITPGALGTASVTVGSYKAGMVAQNADTSVLNALIVN
jgi:hypothetical protein